MEKYMKLALKEALKGLEEDEVPIGAVIVKDGKVIEFERIPIIEDEVQNYSTFADNILSVASTISFTPFEIEWQGNPALDVGDVITLPNGNDSITRMVEARLTLLKLYYQRIFRKSNDK